MKQNVGKEISIFLTMLLLVLSNSRWLADNGIESYFEYGAYFLMLCGVLFSFLKAKRAPRVIVGNILLFAAVSVLFSVGILLQGLVWLTRLRLVATMLVLSATAILAEDYFDSLRTIRVAGYGVLAGLLTATVLAIVVGDWPVEPVHEGLLPYGFTGGLQYKNYFAAVALGSFMSLLFYRRYAEKRRVDAIVMLIELVLIFVSCARGTYIFFAVFLLAFYADMLLGFIKRLRVYAVLERFWQARSKNARRWLIVAACVLAVLLVAAAFCVLVQISETYAYRFRGVKNYLVFSRGDWYHLLFGNAEMAWSNPNMNYVETIRDFVGWNGSYEMGFINTLIKNGILGIIGFVLLFAHVIRHAYRASDHRYRMMAFSVLCVLLFSAFVESFVCNIHAIFGVYCYLLLSGATGMSRRAGEVEGVTPFAVLREGLKR